MENKNQETSTQAKQEQAGFITRVMPVLSKSGEYVSFYLPGGITVTEHVNRFKGLMKVEYTPKPQGEKREFQPRTGLHAKVGMSISENGEWITVYLPGTLGRIVNHINAYKYIFGIEYTKKAKAA